MGTAFRGSTYFYQTDVASLVEANIIEFFNWGFVNQGAYVNANIPLSGAYGGDFSRLRPVNDPRYSTGQVWEGIRSNWVWESGLSYGTPINISGVFVGSTLRISGYTIDYPNGRVIFSSGIATNSIVRVGHSFKEVQVMSAQQNPMFYDLQSRSHRPDDPNFLAGSGLYANFSDQKINLPCVSVSTANRSSRGFQLGGGKWVNYRVKMYVLAEDEAMAKKISDTICNQENETIYAFDLDTMAASGAFPLKFDGSLNTNPKTYPQLVAYSGDGGYRTTQIQQGKIFFKEVTAQNGQYIHQNLYLKVIDLNAEIINPNI